MDVTDADLLYESEQLALTPHLPRMLARVAPEIVVVGDSVLRDGSSPSGAAALAVSLAGLGAAVELVSVCGDDLRGTLLRRQLIDRGVGTSGLLVEAGRRTSPDGARSIEDGTARAVAGVLAEKVRYADCVLIADHGRGVAADRVRQLLTALRAGLPPLIVDAGDLRPWAGTRPDLVALTLPGAATLLGIPLPDGYRIEGLGAELASTSGADAQLVTLDDGGTLLVTARARPYRTWASPPGGRRAGATADSVVATLTLGMVAELPPETSAELAQTVADVTAGLPDSLVCTTDGLAARLAGYHSAALPRAELERLVRGHKLAGRRVIVTSGGFDRLHAGDLEALNQARRLGDVLVVAVHSDTVVPRPLRPARSRAAAVVALSSVDHVTITDNEVLVDLLDRLGPDLYVRP